LRGSHFAYLEINPLVCLDNGEVHFLDMAAKLDQVPTVQL
jgi:ATP citrate (pro-S)-lyase